MLICTALPMPTEPNEIEPGLALASAMKSWMVFQGRAFGTIITLALDPIISTEARSRRGVEGRARENRRRNRQRRRMGENAVAVGIGFRDQRRTERAAAAGAVFDHDRLAEFGGEAIEHQPRHHVGRAAGAERNGRLDQPRRPALAPVQRWPSKSWPIRK